MRKCTLDFLSLSYIAQARRNKIHIGGGLKPDASGASKNLGPPACPRENFL